MADSEDEYERRRRDKFRRERNDFQDRREPRNREDWEDRPRDNWKGRVRKEPFRDFDRRRERYPAPHLEREYSPPPHNTHIKRIRRDWDEAYYPPPPPVNSHYHPAPIHPPYPFHDFQNAPPPLPLIPTLVNHRNDVNENQQLGMLSFKEFLIQQEDGIDPEEAIKKYKDYKIQYQKSLIHDFFQAHKEEEWFKNKYHPDDCVKAKFEKEGKIKYRLKVFMEFYNKGFIDKFSLDQDQLKEIVKFLDAVIIKLEGGSDNDIKYLDEEYASAIVLTEEVNVIEGKAKDDEFDPEAIEIKEKKDNLTNAPETKTKGKKSKVKKDKEKKKVATKVDGGAESDGSTSSKSSSSSASSNGSSSSHSSSSSSTSHASSISLASAESSALLEKGKKKKETQVKDNVKDVVEKQPVGEKLANGDKSPTEDGETKDEEDDKKVLGTTTVAKVAVKSNLPIPFHRTSSIFLRNLPPNVTRAEVENLCKNYPGYLRVALADPLPERKFYRRGWITFNRDANVKEICANLNSSKIKDCDMGPIVNRDIIRRVRLVNGIVIHRPIVKKDISLAARIVEYFDSKFNLWTKDEESLEIVPEPLPIETAKVEDDEKDDASYGDKADDTEHKGSGDHALEASTDENMISAPEETLVQETMPEFINVDSLPSLQSWSAKTIRNPILRNLLDELIAYIKMEEEIAQKQHIISMDVDHQSDKDVVLEEGEERGDEKDVVDQPIKDANETVDKVVTFVGKNEKLNKLLDKVILYLRIVHSMDYYSISEYPNEDDMPNKCGIIHCRGALTQTKLLTKDVEDWMRNFESKIRTFISPSHTMTKQEANDLGLRNYETEVEKFVKANTQELAKDKWLCPISGKKFKGPDFVRKHIFNKHAEKIEEVKKEVDFFNNYLLDSKRSHNHDGSTSTLTNNQVNISNKNSGIIKNIGIHHHFPHHASNFVNHPPQPANSYPDYPPQRNYYQPHYPMRGGHDYDRNSYQRKRLSGGSREIIQYRDLDAPEENDIF